MSHAGLSAGLNIMPTGLPVQGVAAPHVTLPHPAPQAPVQLAGGCNGTPQFQACPWSLCLKLAYLSKFHLSKDEQVKIVTISFCEYLPCPLFGSALASERRYDNFEEHMRCIC